MLPLGLEPKDALSVHCRVGEKRNSVQHTGRMQILNAAETQITVPMYILVTMSDSVSEVK